MYADYDDACTAILTQSQARHAVVNEHGADWDEFTIDCGSHDHYTGQIVLDFLGY